MAFGKDEAKNRAESARIKAVVDKANKDIALAAKKRIQSFLDGLLYVAKAPSDHGKTHLSSFANHAVTKNVMTNAESNEWLFLEGTVAKHNRLEWHLKGGLGKPNGFPEGEGMLIAIRLPSRPESRWLAIAAAKDLIQSNSVSWLLHDSGKWQVDTQKLAEAFPNVTRFGWLRGQIVVEPEYQPEDVGVVTYNKPYRATVAFYLVPEIFISRSNQPPKHEPSITAADVQLLKRHNSGLYGVVWEGQQLSLSRKVAIKIIKPSMAGAATAAEHARALARLNHPNIVTVHHIASVHDPESGEAVDGVVMEWIDGESLGDRIRGPLFSTGDARFICHAILDGVEHMHGNRLPHGDLHAGNVLISNSAVKIIDVNYFDAPSLDRLSAGSVEMHIQSDIDSLRFLVRRILYHSEVATRISAEDDAVLASADSADQIRQIVKNVCGLQ